MLSPVATARIRTPGRVVARLRSVKSALEKIDADIKIHQYRIREYQPNVRLFIERGNYIVKTAENGAELEQCLKLRFDVFHREYKNKKRAHGIDVDGIDYGCDHLLIIDRRVDKVIGTYRLNSSLFAQSFYSAGEFDIETILELEGNKLELGRACIDREHRNGVVIALLWRGIAEYIQKTDTSILFGCASIKTMEPMEIGLITHHFSASGLMDRQLHARPTRKYRVRSLPKVLQYIEANPFEYRGEDVEKSIPTLVKSYFRAGVKVCGEPAIDREFRCIDFLIVLKVDEMNAQHKDKYKL